MIMNALWKDTVRSYCDRMGYELLNIYGNNFEYLDNTGTKRVMFSRELAEILFR